MAQDNEQTWEDCFWESPDGLKLHFRDYGGGSDTRPPIICLPGLTRNARDFEPVVGRFSPAWRILAVEFRGRGMSDYSDDPATYTPATYVGDLLALLEQHGIDRFVSIGTSLGGIVTMLLATVAPDKIAGAVLNDVGPEIDPAGIARIRDYVGQGRSYPTWMHAARALEEVHGSSFPSADTEDWLKFAKRTMCVGNNGRIQLDYDMKIAEPFRNAESAAPPDLWPAYDALEGRPLLFLRGEVSDLFSKDTLAEMQKRIPDSSAATVPGVGHAPTLDEPEALDAIARLLDRIE